MRIRKALLLTLLVIVMATASCSGSTEVTRIVEVPATVIANVMVEVTRQIQVQVTREIEVTVPVPMTVEMEVTRIVDRPVTVTFTPTPVNTPTPSDTPTITPTPSDTPTPTPSNTPTATPNVAQTETIQAYGALADPRGDGFYTIGTEILPGKWHSIGTGRGCYWARLDVNQDTLDNHFGLAGGTVTIRESDYEVEFDDCGIWEYVENVTQVLQDDATDPKSDGFYTVGVEIAPGRWESTGTGDGCYWARIDAFQNVRDNHFGNAGGSVTITTSDYEVELNDCGIWEFRG